MERKALLEGDGFDELLRDVICKETCFLINEIGHTGVCSLTRLQGFSSISGTPGTPAGGCGTSIGS